MSGNTSLTSSQVFLVFWIFLAAWFMYLKRSACFVHKQTNVFLSKVLPKSSPPVLKKPPCWKVFTRKSSDFLAIFHFQQVQRVPQKSGKWSSSCPIIFQGQTVSFRGSWWHFLGLRQLQCFFPSEATPRQKNPPNKQPFPMDTTFELYPLFGIYWVASPILLIFKMKTSKVDNPGTVSQWWSVSTKKTHIKSWSLSGKGVSPKNLASPLKILPWS